MNILNSLFTKRSRPSQVSYLETLASQARNSRTRKTAQDRH